MNDSILSYQGVKFHVVPMIGVVHFCGRFTFVGFKIVFTFSSGFTFVEKSKLRLWRGLQFCGKIGLRLWAFYIGGRVYV